ncbi:hypothetical protein G3T36_17325 [Diaminobutyricibacter tongyongensis]|uniref:Uncharacterized protein n=1 Tax=Leifsonia tongyongensis TaxID=1268043 RepID=A0A6L9Y1Q6_9MICO|nr:hypothetical protein [Diaminobutyricibacter tongyongensis]NEN07621.1 hypothetical protein [Diaminobutyricibacter tongyongensis]
MSEGPTVAGSIIAKLRIDMEQFKADAAEAKGIARELGAMEPTVKVDAKVGDAIAQLEAVRVASDGVGKSNTNLGNTAGFGASRMALIAGAVALLLPMLPALAGYSTGVAGALAGMGAAGILAIFGVKNAMEEGTAAGNTFSAGLQILKGDFNQLAGTAASSMLSAFTQSISTLNSYMPALNGQIGVFGKQLGITSNFLVSGVLKAFEVLNPLFVQAGVYVEQLALGFQRWTQDGGLQQFTQMAIASLPQVATALGSLVKGTLDLVGAFAPLGTFLLGALTTLGQLASLISPLLANLTPLALGAGTVYGAFLLWKNIAPTVRDAAAAVRGFGLDLSVVGGVAGIAVAALGYIASSFITSRMASEQAASALQDYTAAVQADNGVIGENIRQQTAKALADKDSLGQYNSLGKSAIDIGRQLGLSAKTVEAAAIGQRAAILKVNQAMTDYANNPANSTAKVAEFRANWINLTGVISDNQKHIQAHIKAYNDVAKAQGFATINTKAQLQAQTDLAQSYGMSLPQLLAARGAQKQNADSAAAATQQLQLENDAATLLTNAFTILNGGMLSVAQAQTGAAAATNTLLDSFKQNGTAIDGNTKAAVANQQAIESKVSADQQAAEAIAKQTGSTQAGTKAYGDSKVALENQLRATHNLTPAIQAYIDKLYDVKNLKVPPTVLEINQGALAKAKANIADFKAMLASITRNIQVGATVVVSGPTSGLATTAGKALVRADGGPVPAHLAAGGTIGSYLAAGGFPFQAQGTDTIPAMLSPHEFVIKASSASYNPGFLRAYNQNPRAAMAAAAPVTHNTTWNISGPDPDAVIAGIQFRQRAAGLA